MATEAGLTDYDRRVTRQFLREYVPAFIGYLVVLGVVTKLIDFETAGPWKYLAALAPAVPLLGAIRAIVRSTARLDELQRDIRLRATATGFWFAMIIAMTLGFLGKAGLETSEWAPWAIFAGGQLAWAITELAENWRHGRS